MIPTLNVLADVRDWIRTIEAATALTGDAAPRLSRIASHLGAVGSFVETSAATTTAATRGYAVACRRHLVAIAAVAAMWWDSIDPADDGYAAVLGAIRDERIRQEEKHGDMSMVGSLHDEEGRLAVLVEEVGEVAEALNDAAIAEWKASRAPIAYYAPTASERRVDAEIALRGELVQVAAVAVAWCEVIDRRAAREGGAS